jgi:hypothetical protein
MMKRGRNSCRITEENKEEEEGEEQCLSFMDLMLVSGVTTRVDINTDMLFEGQLTLHVTLHYMNPRKSRHEVIYLEIV